jgi:hypothetical protein
LSTYGGPRKLGLVAKEPLKESKVFLAEREKADCLGTSGVPRLKEDASEMPLWCLIRFLSTIDG